MIADSGSGTLGDRVLVLEVRPDLSSCGHGGLRLLPGACRSCLTCSDSCGMSFAGPMYSEERSTSRFQLAPDLRMRPTFVTPLIAELSLRMWPGIVFACNMGSSLVVAAWMRSRTVQSIYFRCLVAVRCAWHWRRPLVTLQTNAEPSEHDCCGIDL